MKGEEEDNEIEEEEEQAGLWVSKRITIDSDVTKSRETLVSHVTWNK